ncbi:N-acetylneuraminate synthase family protein [Murimonas intestini]|uniref:N-acetylneuraminate synthase family protein n=1 Tax=Murimonas intestini TaxID=1337051 RepID=UPI0011DDBC0F|nr:N-acetylneuraminate synthase family protein [Murimonas intestini]
MNMFEKLDSQGYYLIAEIGVNFYDIAAKENIALMDAAKLMVKEAQKAGVDAVKFQSYKAGTLAAKYSPSYWDTSEEATTSQYELFQKFDKFGESEYKELAKYAQQLNVDFLSTPFDFESSDYLDRFMPMYKISSSDVTNLPFIEHISKKDKPIILSVGASNEDEIIRAVDAIRNNNNQPLILLHCVLEYPTPYEHANLLKIKTLVEKFPNCIIGYSDHTKPDVHKDVIKAAYLMGAKVIEKHFTLDKTLKGNDHYHAMDPSDIVEIKQGLDFIKQLEGNRELVCLDSEIAARINARRSIVTKQDIPQGTVITREMITFKRPGLGISPSQIEEVIGKTAAVDLDEDTIMKEEMIN